MSIELPEPSEVAMQSALSLANGYDVNGLEYYKFTTEFPIDDFDSEETDLRAEAIAPTMLLYYPAHVVTEDPFAAALQMGQGDHVGEQVLRAVIESGSSKDVLTQFVKCEPMAAVVDFVRETSREGVPLLDKRNSLLREHQAPLAAVAIRANKYRYQAVLSAPGIVWPWAAFAEMNSFINKG